ncbi:MAG TPA: hypothetical protein VFW12_06785 [Candidatus Limnocylindria bacterium]|nr:hypothetical protein [Candidatus Limnocylindria bacterium]
MRGLPGSYCQSGTCGGQCADAIAPYPDAVTVAAPAGTLAFDVSAPAEVHEITINLFAGDTPTSVPRTYVLQGRERRHVAREILPGTYYLHVMTRWKGTLTSGDQSHAYRLIVRGG